MALRGTRAHPARPDPQACSPQARPRGDLARARTARLGHKNPRRSPNPDPQSGSRFAVTRASSENILAAQEPPTPPRSNSVHRDCPLNRFDCTGGFPCPLMFTACPRHATRTSSSESSTRTDVGTIVRVVRDFWYHCPHCPTELLIDLHLKRTPNGHALSSTTCEACGGRIGFYLKPDGSVGIEAL